MATGKYFEGFYFINNTPFTDEVIARVSVVWEKAKILGATSVSCEFERQEFPDGYVEFIVDVSFSKESVSIGRETLSFSIVEIKSINYFIEKGFENETI